MNIPKDLATAFLKKQLWWLLLNYVLVSEFFFFLKVSKDIAFKFISLFHIQIQGPTSMSAIMRAFVFLAKFAEF